MRKKLQLRSAHWGFAMLMAASMATSAFAQADQPKLVVTKQLDTAYVAVTDDGGKVDLSFEVKSDNAVSYQWYKSVDGTTEKAVAIEGATGSSYTTPAFKAPVYENVNMNDFSDFDIFNKDIGAENIGMFYYCVATTVDTSAMSKVTLVMNTGLPTLYVNTPDGVEITSKEKWTKKTKLTLKDAGKDNFVDVSTSFRGRGNSTWKQDKKPYAIKLDEKQKILGMPKHKRWVLIANYLDNTFMRNELAFALSRMVGLDYTVRGKFVNLVFNGVYRGLYWLGEAIKVDKNRVNINDGEDDMTADQDKDFLIEMDTHYDEIVKFHSPIRNIPYMIKNDDYMLNEAEDGLSADGEARLARFQEKIAKLENLLYDTSKKCMADPDACRAPDESYTNIIDVASWAKFWFVNEMMDNTELLTDPNAPVQEGPDAETGPKSAYFTYENGKDLFKAGPVWDFDAGLKSGDPRIKLDTSIYFNALFKSPSFVTAVKKTWKKFSVAENKNILYELILSARNLVVAAKLDSMRWGAHKDFADRNNLSFIKNFELLLDAFMEKGNAVRGYIRMLSGLESVCTFIKSEGKKIAVIDGEFDGDGDIDIPKPVMMDGVSFVRSFTPGIFSTLMLPFDVNTANVRGVNMVLKFNGLKQKEGKTFVSMKKVWVKGESQNDADIKANTPYMVLMDEASLRIDGGVTFKKTEEPVASVEGSDWEFHGTLEYKQWKEGDADLGRVYGFAAVAQDGISAGQFVKAGAGAYIYPLRAYLLAPKKASGVRGVAGNTISTMSLPENIDVVIEEDDVPATEPKTTVIGSFNTRTGEFKMNTVNRVYDLKGRFVGNSANKARGAYYGKKTVK